MPPRKHEIYWAQLPLRESVDGRSWVVLDEPFIDPEKPGEFLVTVAPVSAALDLFSPARDFQIHADEPDFGKTGLKKSSYIAGGRAVHASMARLGKKKGALTGDLLARFVKWSAGYQS